MSVDSLQYIPKSIKDAQRREKISSLFGRMTHLAGRHPYLYPEEAAELITCIIEWPDVLSRPKISDLPTLVCEFFLFVLPFFSAILFRLMQSEKNEMLSLRMMLKNLENHGRMNLF
jgi:hypothetical protein